MPNWNEVLVELQQQVASGQAQLANSMDAVRRKYLIELNKHTKRNVISYYSGWLSKPNILQSEISDEDKNGFMMAVHRLDRSKGLDLILHTPGGSIAAAESIVDYLHQMFESDIRAIVPQLAMSAGTMIACACKEIVMGKQSNLGPIDPHLQGVPANGVIREFKKALEEIKKDPAVLQLWLPIISQYRPTFLGQCEQANKYAGIFVGQQLEQRMFKDDADAKVKAAKILRALSDDENNMSHSRHIHIDECESLGLKIYRLETDSVFQDLVLTVHHCYMHSLTNTPAYKIIENHIGGAMVRNTQ